MAQNYFATVTALEHSTHKSAIPAVIEETSWRAGLAFEVSPAVWCQVPSVVGAFDSHLDTGVKEEHRGTLPVLFTLGLE